MIARRFATFRKLGLGTACAMGLYIVTSQVAAERNALERVERQIVETRKDIVQLETELGTRGSMRQLERWNGEVLALTTPDADQFMSGARQLASLGEVAEPAGPRHAPSAVVTAMVHAPPPPPPIAATEMASDVIAPKVATAARKQLVREAVATKADFAMLPKRGGTEIKLAAVSAREPSGGLKKIAAALDVRP